jgi:hypothetical protein
VVVLKEGSIAGEEFYWFHCDRLHTGEESPATAREGRSSPVMGSYWPIPPLDKRENMKEIARKKKEMACGICFYLTNMWVP